MTHSRIITAAATCLAAAAFILPSLAAAASQTPAPVSPLTPTSSCDASGTKTTVQGIITRGNCRIKSRLTDLDAAIERVAQMDKVSSSTKDTLTTNLNNGEDALNTIKTKLDADTDLATAKADYRTIFNSVRVYGLLLPQTWTVAGADRAQGIASDLAVVSQELQTACTAQSDSTSCQALIDKLNASIASAQSNATNAVNFVQGLLPDNGDNTKRTANKQALSDGANQVSSAKNNLQDAIDDVNALRKMLSLSGS